MVSISGAVSASFQYDPFGRRVSKTIGAATITFLYDGVNPVQELSSGSATANLLTGLIADGYFQRTDASGPANFLTDALGSTIALTGPGGNMLARYSYDAYGNTTITGSSTNPYEYTGRENDGTGLYFYRSRYYSPSLQRFISEDPTEFGGGINLYAYVGGSPTDALDPLGTQGLAGTILNLLFPPPPAPPGPSVPAGPAILYTQYGTGNTSTGTSNYFNPNGTTTFCPGGDAQPFQIPTLVQVDRGWEKSNPGPQNPHCGTYVVGVFTGGKYAGPAFGGVYINTGDALGRGIHGGGSSLNTPGNPNGAYAPNQPLTPTHGCTRAHNQDVRNLANVINQYMAQNPNLPITYCRGYQR